MAPIVFVSAATKQRVGKIVELALAIQAQRQQRVPTGRLNAFLREALLAQPPRGLKGRQLKVLYLSQVAVAPPTFVFWVNDPELVHFSYRRFLENRLRERYGFEGTPIRIFFRARRES